MNQSFYKCSHCGKIIAVVKESGVPVICCGEPMRELVAGTISAAEEKHVPVVKVVGNQVIVSIGEVEHPMTAEHSIEWISIQTKQGNQRKVLTNGKPQATFAICEDDEIKVAYAYCNLHGLWKADIANTSKCATNNAKTLENGDYIVCNCNKVSYMDIVNELQKHSNINDLLKAFEHIKDITHCSTGCGGCYDKVMAILSDTMNE